jgi:putative glycosyltransferase (TIGR04348 family)
MNNGNRVTAVRWAGIIRKLGHRLTVDRGYRGEPCDLMIALHARRSFDAIQRFHRQYPERPLIVVLTGTDLYRDIHRDQRAQRSLELATRLVALQRMAYQELPQRLHSKTRIIYQSAAPLIATRRPRRSFRVAVIGHLRKEKDPLRAAMAARRLPAWSRIEITQIGRPLNAAYRRRALAETARNQRYRWFGERPHAETRRILSRSDLLVISSFVEGSANVLSEALASAVPVIASRISGLIGTLGEDYPGYFAPGDTAGLRQLLLQAETDGRLYRDLRRRGAALRKLVEPGRELQAWKALLREFT